jgi:hypothetical protein
MEFYFRITFLKLQIEVSIGGDTRKFRVLIEDENEYFGVNELTFRYQSDSLYEEHREWLKDAYSDYLPDDDGWEWDEDPMVFCLKDMPF